QSSIITPKPGDANHYYLFTMEEVEAELDGTPGRGFSFFEIDMDLDGGLGGVVAYEESLVLQCSEGISAYPHGNGRDYWVVVFNQETAALDFFLVSPAGVQLDQSTPLPVFPGQAIDDAPIRFSPDGSKLFIPGILFDFDVNTGATSNAQPIGVGYGVTFSPNSEYLYLIENGEDINIVRFEANVVNALDSRLVVAQITDEFLLTGQMQVAPDGNLYFIEQSFIANTINLSAIVCPNAPSPCLQRNVLSFPDRETFVGLPNFTDHFFQDDAVGQELTVSIDASQVQICDASPITLTANNLLAETYTWSTGATTSEIEVTEGGLYSVTVSNGCCNTGTASIEVEEGSGNGASELTIAGADQICEGQARELTAIAPLATSFAWSTGSLEATTSVTAEGTYRVTITDACGSTLTESIELSLAPPLDLELMEETALACASTAIFSVSTTADSILWSTGERTSSIEINQAGNYTVTVSNACESRTENFEVAAASLFYLVPSAFTPDSDGTNDVFGPVWNCNDIQNFELVIYSRWGERVFQTTDPFQGWDGTFEGSLMPSDVFLYSLVFNDPSGERQSEQGNVTLIR
ncbi:MAG: T9SS type B sorting domain-containing protein, partial [Bacteroidota bacterium]